MIGDTVTVTVDRPFKEYTGKGIAVIYRTDDIEHKWVVAPEGSSFTAGEIEQAVHF